MIDPRVRKNVELACACGAHPAMVLAIAVITTAPRTVAEAVAYVRAHGDEIASIAALDHAVPGKLAELEPALRSGDEIARVLRDARDHELRGSRVFRDLVGAQSFVQVAALAIDGVRLGAEDARLLEDLGVNTQLADPGIWPLNVVRRVAANAGFAHATVAGLAALLNPHMAAAPVGAFIDVLARLEAGVRAGQDVDTQLSTWLARGERIAGVGRPALGPDERNAQVVALARANGHDAKPSFRLAMAVDNFFAREKAIHINSAGLQAAIMRDMGFTARGATAFCVLYFMVPVLAQAAFGANLRESAGHAPAA